ncbi:MAG: SpoIIE family protein phosphatase, partial [Leptospiraceae bacterium]|nr:SpoIIE family protein phosphatase [Leptospiraceae bacterium]
GTPGTNAARSKAGFLSGISPAPVGSSGELDLIIQVSNYDYRAGGIRQSVLLGASGVIYQKRQNIISFDLLIAGALLIIGMYHLFIFLLRRNDRSPLFFALHCLVIAIRPLTIDEQVLYHFFPAPGSHFYLALEYSTLPLSVLTFLFFLRSVFPRDFHTKIIQLLSIPGIILLALPFVLDTLELSRAITLYQAHLLISGLYGLICMILAAIRKRDFSGAMLLGGLPLFLGTVYDVMVSRSIVPIQQLGALNLLVFICVYAGILSIRYARSFKQVESLSTELHRKNAELRHLDELKNEFLANTSHELRTPLHGIIGITESILQGATGKISEETRANLRLVASSGRRLTTLVNDILDFSKATHGDLTIQTRSINLVDAIDMAFSLITPLLRDRPVELIHQRDPSIRVQADPERLNQILLNLLGNAVKFTRHGRITVSMQRIDTNMVRITVSDTGIGIPEDRLEIIFESFTQADGSISRQYSGTGLGLSITRKLVELHGGQISVQSRPGSGSTFEFTLPEGEEIGGTQNQMLHQLDIPQEDADSPAHDLITRSDILTIDNAETTRLERNEKGAQPHDVSGRVRTLIVDDDPVNLQVLKNLLSLRNHEVVEAASGRDALQLIEERPGFDLILLDIMMPGLTGYEVCRILRETHSPSELPVVILTAKNRTEDVVQGLASGANDYLAKPFEPAELQARVDNMLALREAARSQASLAVLNHELQTAYLIQQSMLPAASPRIPGFRIATRYRAMINVGGDYYDFLPDESGLGIIMADVSGHGVPAALIVSLLKMAFLYQSELIEFPARVLVGMNRILYQNTGNEFITACGLFINTRNRTLRVANAGHPPLLLWRKSTNTIEELRPAGRILGIWPEIEIDSPEPVQLESGDRILLYTDGAFEITNDQGQQFGMTRLESFLRAGQNLNVDDFSDRLLADLLEWVGDPKMIQDDIAMVVIDVE